uniref:Uncharacterized protein n=1 Tax=Rhizophora mucronata TaxID=61149 RepID=A0A2P2R049_RHIMU
MSNQAEFRTSSSSTSSVSTLWQMGLDRFCRELSAVGYQENLVYQFESAKSPCWLS